VTQNLYYSLQDFIFYIRREANPQTSPPHPPNQKSGAVALQLERDTKILPNRALNRQPIEKSHILRYHAGI
jgi:hypothetical protein